jgi:Arc/MetJ family transcription regulator
MKTTIDIADSLLRRVRALAAARNTTMREIVESALRDALAQQERRHGRVEIEAPTFKGNGLQPGVSWDDWASVRSVAYEGRGG